MMICNHETAEQVNSIVTSFKTTHLHLHFGWRKDESEREDSLKVLHADEGLKDGPSSNGLTLGGIHIRSASTKEIHEYRVEGEDRGAQVHIVGIFFWLQVRSQLMK